MSQAIIRAAFETALKTWATANSLPVQWQNTILDPEPAAYVRTFLLPAPTEAPDVQRLGREYLGVWQVSIVRPIGEGPGQGEALADSLAAVFPPATPIVRSGLSIYILQPLSPAPAVSEGARHVLPCSLSYRATVY